jgi:hypothetical protein
MRVVMMQAPVEGNLGAYSKSSGLAFDAEESWFGSSHEDAGRPLFLEVVIDGTWAV